MMYMSGIMITEVRIKNFRSIKNVSLKLERFNILLGENNAGKTSFLEALLAAIGSENKSLTKEDVYISSDEVISPNDRFVLIDVLIQPVSETGELLGKFPEGSFWIRHFGDAVTLDEEDNEFVGIRTQYKFDLGKGQYYPERRYLVEWKGDSEDWENSKVKDRGGLITGEEIEPLMLYYIDAKRDIEDETKNAGSLWRKLVGNLGILETEIESIDQDLLSLNEKIISNSEMLAYIQRHLDDFHKVIVCQKDSVCLTPLVKSLRDINRDININFSIKGGQSFPIGKHGAGTRSLASLFIFRAYAYWRINRSSRGSTHPILALEEPEVNLHPQAQKALFEQINQLPGQIFISTHSPYIASQGKVQDFRHFQKNGGETIINKVETSTLDSEDLRKIDRMVLNTRGDLLFTRAIILFEGETEEQSLPIFAEKFWGQHPNSLGVTFIGVGGSGNYLPFLRLANGFKIPWYIFSDGESSAIKDVKAALASIGIADLEDCRNVTILPDEYNFESYIVNENYEDAIAKMLDFHHGITDYIDQFISEKHGTKGKKGISRDYSSSDGRNRAIVDILKSNKTKYGSLLPHYILELESERRFPAKILELFNKISLDLEVRV